MALIVDYCNPQYFGVHIRSVTKRININEVLNIQWDK